MRSWKVLVSATGAWALCGLLAFHAASGEELPPSLAIISPLNEALFPRDFAPPTFRWKDTSLTTRWRVKIETGADRNAATDECPNPEWHPSAIQWEKVKAQSLARSGRFIVTRLSGGATTGNETPAQISFQTSSDPVAASIFYREVPLPVGFAMDNKPLLKWKVGDVSSDQPPRTVLSGMKTCANCHSFTPDGKTLAMDIDFGSDKSTYAIADIGKNATIGPRQLIAWNDYRREDGVPTLGFLSAISPNGRYVVSTVKETIVLHFLPDPLMSQIFFPVRGILVSYDRKNRSFRSVPGADDPAFVQTNGIFSPDGRWLIFARASVPDIPRHGTAVDPDQQLAISSDFEEGRRKIQFELYRVPFNEGRGGKAEPVPGAAGNEKSNFFPRYSPDGRWIVFCQADSMMLNRPDSTLFIVSTTAAGSPRRLKSNALGRMNSWHSFSPNGRWLVFSSKRSGALTQMWLTHIDEKGEDSVPVMLDGFVAADRAANLPEFLNITPGQLQEIQVADEIRNSTTNLPIRPN